MKNSLTFLFVLMFINSIQANPDEAEKVVDTSPPGTEIVLANIQIVDGASRITNEKNITSFKGYDSQPAFMENDKAIYFTRFVKSQTDIYRIDLETLQTSAYTQTPESEYSPTKTSDKGVISVVRVDKDNAQHVYQIRPNQPEAEAKIVSDIDNVGYHNWTSNKGLWMFVINQDQGNLFYQAKGMKPKMMAENIGRSIKTNDNNNAVYYVDKSKESWWINQIDAETFKITAIIELPLDVEDFTIDSSGNFWIGIDNILLRSYSKQWGPVKEFDLPNLSNISRIAINKTIDQIAIVFDEKTP